METMSMVEICGTNRIKCGYCKPNTKTSVSYGVLAKRLTCTDYQELIDRGWRRSGTFVYKPVMHETCCPQYTIRLDVTRFKHTKGHRQVLNRLKRYLEGDKESGGSTGASGQHMPSDRKGSSAAGGGNGDSGGRKKRGVPRGALKGKQASANGDSRRGDPEKIGPLSELVAAAAVDLVEGGTVSGLNLGPDWRSEVAGWSQVRPIRNNQNEKAVAPGGGFCSAVALSIASAARKRGWKGTDVVVGAVAIAEATAKLLRSRGSEEGGQARLSAITVAPNGFINFQADFGPSSTLASSNHANIPEANALPEARSGVSPIPAATPPLPPAPGLALHGDIPLVNGASGSERKAAETRTSVRDEVVVEGEVGGAASSAGLESTGAAAGSTKAVVASSGGAAALPTGEPPGQVGTVAGLQDGGSIMAAASMEWIERQGDNNGDGMVDMEVSATTSSETSTAGPSSSGSKTGLASLPPLDPGVAPHRMTVSTVPARVTDEVFRLYVKYQVSVHGDDPSEVTPGQFRRFLVDSPLIRETIGGKMIRPRKPSTRRGPSSRPAVMLDDESKGVPQGGSSEMTQGQDSLSVPYGSYHQLYRIDGKLVAVGVVDILPKCLSSVYCFYDPEYRALALGKLTALKETEFVKEAHAVRPGMKDYYMGFYIHSCPKMSYKGSYTPSSLLCPERLTWVPLELCRPVLDAHKYSRLSDLLEPPQLAQTSGGVEKGAQLSNGNRRDGDSWTAGFEGGAGSPAHRSPGSGSYSPLSSLSPDRREARQRRPHKEAGLSPTRPVPADGAGANLFGGRGGGEEMVGMAAGAARRAAAARAVRAAANEASRIDEIPLMLGHPAFPVNLTALTPQSQALVRDVLMTYAATIGSDLAKRVVLKLHD